jgi:beta-glucosidase
MPDTPLYLNPEADLDARVDDLIGRMTLEEKALQLVNDTPAIERLGVPAYNYWSEALHGVARAGLATVFPQAISLAAMWDAPLMFRIATAISDEGRAKYHATKAHGAPTWYTGLTFWSPNINIFRDPRWGRGHETYGEDPYLTGTLGVEFIKGLQGDDPHYMKAAACAKHYAVHSGPESLRWEFDAVCSAKDLRETYLPAFEMAVREAGVEAVMGAYNMLYGVPCCASTLLLQQILRDEWGFDGHVVSDCGAIRLFHESYKVTQTPEESVAMGLKGGCDLNCGAMYALAPQALEQGLITEADMDLALHRALRTRFKLGMFDDDARVHWASIPTSVVNSPEHRALARQAAHKGIVLLKNNGILPLDPKAVKSIMLSGPTANINEVLLGNYNGLNPELVTPLEGILGAVGPEVKVHFVTGCRLLGKESETALTVSYASVHALNIVFLGLAPELEGEAGDASGSGDPDRPGVELPAGQERFLKAVKQAGTPVILVLSGGSAMAVPWAQEYVDAIIWIGYPGEEGGNALADILSGKVNPSGRLPMTWYNGTADLPSFVNYAMEGRTYRYFRGEPLYPFGYGLSYTTFAYRDLALSATRVKAGDPLTVSATVTNTGDREGEEVVQLYITDLAASVATPISQLCGYQQRAVW